MGVLQLHSGSAIFNFKLDAAFGCYWMYYSDVLSCLVNHCFKIQCVYPICDSPHCRKYNGIRCFLLILWSYFFFSTGRLNDNQTFIIWNFSLKPRYHISPLLTDDDPGGQHFWSAPSSSLIYKYTIGIQWGSMLKFMKNQSRPSLRNRLCVWRLW